VHRFPGRGARLRLCLPATSARQGRSLYGIGTHQQAAAGKLAGGCIPARLPCLCSVLAGLTECNLFGAQRVRAQSNKQFALEFERVLKWQCEDATERNSFLLSLMKLCKKYARARPLLCTRTSVCSVARPIGRRRAWACPLTRPAALLCTGTAGLAHLSSST